jgi:hypothetical protein
VVLRRRKFCCWRLKGVCVCIHSKVHCRSCVGSGGGLLLQRRPTVEKMEEGTFEVGRRKGRNGEREQITCLPKRARLTSSWLRFTCRVKPSRNGVTPGTEMQKIFRKSS